MSWSDLDCMLLYDMKLTGYILIVSLQDCLYLTMDLLVAGQHFLPLNILP